MKKDIKRVIRDNIYGNNFTFMVCSAKKMRNQLLRDFPEIDSVEEFATGDGSCITITNPKGKKKVYLWLEKFDWLIVDQGVLTHEVLHLVFETMRTVGIHYEHTHYNVNEEAFTYYYQYVYQMILHELKDLR